MRSNVIRLVNVIDDHDVAAEEMAERICREVERWGELPLWTVEQLGRELVKANREGRRNRNNKKQEGRR